MTFLKKRSIRFRWANNLSELV